MAQLNRGRVSVPAQAALSGSHNKAPGSAGGYLQKALLSSKAFWDFMISPSTPYLDRMAAAIRGNSLLSAGELICFGKRRPRYQLSPTGVLPHPCSAQPRVRATGLNRTRVVLGRQIQIPKDSIEYPITAAERDHSPWLWQMQAVSEILALPRLRLRCQCKSRCLRSTCEKDQRQPAPEETPVVTLDEVSYTA